MISLSMSEIDILRFAWSTDKCIHVFLNVRMWSNFGQFSKFYNQCDSEVPWDVFCIYSQLGLLYCCICLCISRNLTEHSYRLEAFISAIFYFLGLEKMINLLDFFTALSISLVLEIILCTWFLYSPINPCIKEELFIGSKSSSTAPSMFN
jgi:hypothetical protein